MSSDPEARALLDRLRGRGLRVVRAGDKLRVSPPGALSQLDRAAVIARKPALLRLLADGDGGGLACPAAPLPVPTDAPPTYPRWEDCDRCRHRFLSLGADDCLCVVCQHEGQRVPGTRPNRECHADVPREDARKLGTI